jgi:hypothetical protein
LHPFRPRGFQQWRSVSGPFVCRGTGRYDARVIRPNRAVIFSRTTAAVCGARLAFISSVWWLGPCANYNERTQVVIKMSHVFPSWRDCDRLDVSRTNNTGSSSTFGIDGEPSAPNISGLTRPAILYIHCCDAENIVLQRRNAFFQKVWSQLENSQKVPS